MREDHSFHMTTNPLVYQHDYVDSGSVIETAKSLLFPLHPDPKFKRLMEKLPKKGKFTRWVLLGLTAATNASLWKLLLRGVGSGLSHGTMNIIYRIGIDQKTAGILDCLEIANGSLQRRYLIVDQLRSLIDKYQIKNIVSLAGGSCEIPLEAIYQSSIHDFTLTNIDYSEKALQKSVHLVKSLLRGNNSKTINLVALQCDLTDVDLDGCCDELGTVIECTGLWEYLGDSQRIHLLESISEQLQGSNSFLVLTALINNPDHEVFQALGFKKLSPQPREEFVDLIAQHFRIERISITPNETYCTIIATQLL